MLSHYCNIEITYCKTLLDLQSRVRMLITGKLYRRERRALEGLSYFPYVGNSLVVTNELIQFHSSVVPRLVSQQNCTQDPRYL